MLETREQNWESLLNNSFLSEKFHKWLSNNNSIIFPIKNADFKKLNLKPKSMIPYYEKEKLPAVFEKYDIELLRTGLGECILTKTGNKRRYNSLFPSLPKIENHVVIEDLSDIDENSVLFSESLINEDTGIILSHRMNFYNQILSQYLSSQINLEYCGMLNTNVEGNVLLGDEKIKIKSTQMQCDALFEDDTYLVAVEAKKGFRKSFSIHQLAFPLLLLMKEFPSRISFGIFFQFELDVVWKLQFYLIDIPNLDDSLSILDYRFLSSTEICFNHKQNSLLKWFKDG